MKSTFSVIYYLKRQVVKKDRTVPVMGRITVDGSQTQFSCKLTVDPKLWDTKGGRVTGRSTAALETNRMLDKMRVRINKHYQEIMERDNFVTAEKVKNAFLGLEHRYHTLMQVFRQHNEDYEKQVEAGMKAKGTLLKYRTVYKHMQEFLDIRYHVKDIALKELTPAFISDFEMFLRTDKHCCTNTVWLYVCPLRTMVFIAINNEWLTRDPFREYEIKKEETTRSFLTKDEIRLLMEGKLKNAKQELYRELIQPVQIIGNQRVEGRIGRHILLCAGCPGTRGQAGIFRLCSCTKAASLKLFRFSCLLSKLMVSFWNTRSGCLILSMKRSQAALRSLAPWQQIAVPDTERHIHFQSGRYKIFLPKKLLAACSSSGCSNGWSGVSAAAEKARKASSSSVRVTLKVYQKSSQACHITKHLQAFAPVQTEWICYSSPIKIRSFHFLPCPASGQTKFSQNMAHCRIN